MRLQVLVATMNQNDHSLLEKMNIQSEAIVGNQCDRNEMEQFLYQGHPIRYCSFQERGVGLNRNNAFMRADADVCLFSDDDVRYHDGYAAQVLDEFARHPEADVIVFNLDCKNEGRKDYVIPKFAKVRWHNSLRYGTYRIAVRTVCVRRANVAFSLLFGGGAQYGSGEDVIFLNECMKRGLRVYASPVFIGDVTHAESTWFDGYTEKFFRDKGALFAHISHRLAKPLCLQLLLRHREFLSDRIPFRKAYGFMKEGVREYLGKEPNGRQT